ncbi:MAG: hypothetical protein KIG61_01555 [Muribaculaceae bacterium]|nr:hypothetical protein [Muribaculaceae bacterium]
MNKSKINEIKNRVYEAEGLLELLTNRPEITDSILPLVAKRLDEAQSMLKQLPAEPTSEPTLEPTHEPEPTLEPEPDPDPVSLSSHARFNPPAFCLNDRFRFRRSIFGGSDAEFNAAMRHIATLPDYQDALRYLGEEMGVDLEDEDVVDFLEILKPCWS